MTDLSSRTLFLTGATDGLGRAVAEELASHGATLLLHGRSKDKGNQFLSELRASTGNRNLSYELADFSSLQEIQGLADRVLAHGRLDTLVNNAGMGVELHRWESLEGHELTFQAEDPAAEPGRTAAGHHGLRMLLGRSIPQ
jgi:NAD(P)-dependent dehydrogenase (short-subunit alcohol dehydrogenase family)